MKNTYLYDIFFSYKRDPNTDAWHERVSDLIRFWVRKQLNQPDCRVFFDTRDIPLGQDWRDVIGESLRRSKCLVCILSVDYMFSIPCRSELWSFLDRETRFHLPRGTLIAPALFYDGLEFLPSDVQALQYVDFSTYSATIEAFWKTEKAALFEDVIKTKFSLGVAAKIASAPSYDDGFPVVLAKDEAMPPRPRFQRPAELARYA